MASPQQAKPLNELVHDARAPLNRISMNAELIKLEAGAGIVADSDPAREYEETLNKARALLRTGVRIGPAAG